MILEPKPWAKAKALPGMEVGKRGDILGHDFPSEGEHCVLDLRISAIFDANGVLHGPVDMQPGHVAEAGAAEKRASYEQLLPPFSFVPIVYETHGRASDSTSQFLMTAATVATKYKLGYEAVDGSQAFIRQRNSFLGRWCKFVSVCLQRSIAGQIIHGRSAGLDLGPAGFMNMEYADEFQDFV